MQFAHHALELLHLRLSVLRRGVFTVRRKKADAVVAPEIGQSTRLKKAIIQVLVHREKLHRRHADFLQVFRDAGVGQSRIGAAQGLGHIRMPHGEAAHVHLIDHRLPPRRPEQFIALPVKRVIHHYGLQGNRGVIPQIRPLFDADVLHVGMPAVRPGNRLGIGIQQQLARIEPASLPWRPGTVCPVAVRSAPVFSPGTNPRQVSFSSHFRRNRPVSRAGRAGSKRHKSTTCASREYTAKETPSLSGIAPRQGAVLEIS